MLSIGAERADITWAVMDKSMPDHLVLSFEASSAFTARTFFHGAVVRPILAVHVTVRAMSESAHVTRTQNDTGGAHVLE